MATKKVSSKGQTEKTLLPKAPRHEGVDPLTDGNRYYSPENVKQSSTYNQDEAEVKKTVKKGNQLDKEQAQAEEAQKAEAKSAAKKASK